MILIFSESNQNFLKKNCDAIVNGVFWVYKKVDS